jgi:PAS domain S-box-containing protein
VKGTGADDLTTGARRLFGGGAMGDAIRALDWSSTSLGPMGQWPQQLWSYVGLMLNSAQPMFLAWGDDRTWLYNDAFIPILGRKHPDALGRPSCEVWPEAWADLEPMFDRVFSGHAVQLDNFSLQLDRDSRLEEAFFAFSYNPAPGETGSVGGLFGACIETTETVKTSRAAVKADERLQLALDAGGGVGTWDWDIVTDRVIADQRFAALYNVDLAMAQEGAPIAEFFKAVHPDDLPALRTAIESALEGCSAFAVEYRLIQDDGTVRWVLAQGRCVPDADGKPARLPGTSIDITARKTAERKREALVQLTDRVRDIDDPAELAYAAAELLGRTLDVSRAGYGLVDLTRETITIERDWNAPGVTSLAGTLQFRDYGSYIENLARGETVVFEDARTDPRTADNAEALQAISALSVVNVPVTEDTGLVALLYLNHATARSWPTEDVALVLEFAARIRTATERLRVTAVLRETEARLTSLNAELAHQVEVKSAERDRLWRNSQDLLVVIDQSGILQAANPAWQSVLGWNEAEVVGKDHLFFNHPDHLAGSDAALRIARREQPSTYENRTLHKNGSYRWISWVAASEDGLVYASGRDVTVEHEAREELEQTQEALRQSQKMEAVGQLTGGIAHDFNNLLAAISGSLELLDSRVQQGRFEGLDRYITMGQEATRRAAVLTQRLLAFSRRQTLDPRALDANRLLANISDLVQRSVGPNVNVEVVQAGGLWATKVDQSQLENAILNLCINARDAMPDGGAITIETANKWLDARTARARDLSPGQYVSLSVTDTGAGIPPDIVDKVFDPFFTTKPLGQGTGLGLSMIYGFVRQSGGQVRIYSEVGKGTTMCLYLPRFMGPAESDDDEEDVTVDQGFGETVLIIDDEPAIRMLANEVLEENGYRVIEAEDGPSGLKILESDQRIDLLITDVGLPGGLNGRQVADAARTRRPELKVLFVTGYAENAAVGNGHLDPGMAVITKPFAMNAFANKVREMIDE